MGLDTHKLKIIMAVTMLADHVGVVFFPDFIWLRIAGRLSFPIAAFLLSEGAVHTGSMARYLARMGIAAVISEIPYDLAFSGKVFDPGNQNVFLTLFLGLLIIWIIMKSGITFPAIILTAGIMVLSDLIRADYGSFGIILILGFYFFRENRAGRLVFGGILMLLAGGIQMTSALACFVLAFYNGRRGKNRKAFFYCFYPVHLILLWVIKTYILRYI